MQAKIYKCHPDAIIPESKTSGSVGLDLHSIEDFSISPGERKVIGTGLVVKPPEGYHTEIFLRSSMAYKYNIMLINGVGLIDPDYSSRSDELKIMLYAAPLVHTDSNKLRLTFPQAFAFKKGDRVAQLVFRKTERIPLVEVIEMSSTERGGLGSTGK